MAGSTSISRARPSGSASSTATLLADEIADFLRVIKPYLEKSTRRDWGFYREAAEKMLWPRIDDEYRREIDGIVAGLESQGGRRRPLGPGRPQRQPGAALLLRPLARQEGGEDARRPTPPAIAAPSSPRAATPGTAGSSWATTPGPTTSSARAGTSSSTSSRKPGSRIIMDGLPGVIASDDDFGVNSAGMHDHRDDDHPVRGLGPGGQARVRPRPQGDAVQPVDRRLRPDHARRQQRRLCQRLAGRRQQDRRDRALRAGPQEPLASSAPRTAASSAPTSPITASSCAGRDQVRPEQERLVAQRPQGPLGAARSPSTRGRSTSSWASGSRPTTST